MCGVRAPSVTPRLGPRSSEQRRSWAGLCSLRLRQMFVTIMCVLLQSEIMTLSVARCRARRRRPCRHHRALYSGAGRTNGSAAARRTRARSGGVLRAGPRRSGLWRPAYTWRISCPAARRSFYRSARRRGSHLIFCNVAAVPRPRPRPPPADRPSPPRSRDINITELLQR